MSVATDASHSISVFIDSSTNKHSKIHNNSSKLKFYKQLIIYNLYTSHRLKTISYIAVKYRVENLTIVWGNLYGLQ